MNLLAPKPEVWRGNIAEANMAGYAEHVAHPSLDVLHLAGAIDSAAWVRAADLLEEFSRPVLIVFDSPCQRTQCIELFYQAIDCVRECYRLPVAMLLIDGRGYGLELAAVVDLALSTPDTRIGLHAPRLLDGTEATGWRFHPLDVPARGEHWKASTDRLRWLRDNTLAAEAAEMLLGVPAACCVECATNCVADIFGRHPNR